MLFLQAILYVRKKALVSSAQCETRVYRSSDVPFLRPRHVLNHLLVEVREHALQSPVRTLVSFRETSVVPVSVTYSTTTLCSRARTLAVSAASALACLAADSSSVGCG